MLGASVNEEYRCSKCIRRFDGRKDKEEMLKKAKEAKGCETEKTIYVHRIDEVNFRKCPGNFINGSSFYFYELFVRFKEGILPFQGSYEEQPNKIIECFNIIEEWNNKRIEDQEKKRNIKNGRHKYRNSSRV